MTIINNEQLTQQEYFLLAIKNYSSLETHLNELIIKKDSSIGVQLLLQSLLDMLLDEIMDLLIKKYFSIETPFFQLIQDFVSKINEIIKNQNIQTYEILEKEQIVDEEDIDYLDDPRFGRYRNKPLKRKMMPFRQLIPMFIDKSLYVDEISVNLLNSKKLFFVNDGNHLETTLARAELLRNILTKLQYYLLRLSAYAYGFYNYYASNITIIDAPVLVVLSKSIGQILDTEIRPTLLKFYEDLYQILEIETMQLSTEIDTFIKTMDKTRLIQPIQLPISPMLYYNAKKPVRPVRQQEPLKIEVGKLIEKYFLNEKHFCETIQDFYMKVRDEIIQQGIHDYVPLKEGEPIDDNVIYLDHPLFKNIPFRQKPITYSEFIPIEIEKGLYLDEFTDKMFKSEALRFTFAGSKTETLERAKLLLEIVIKLQSYLETISKQASLLLSHEIFQNVHTTISPILLKLSEDLGQMCKNEIIPLREEIEKIIKMNTEELK